MNPRELDLCQVVIGSPSTLGGTASTTSNPSSGGANAQADASTWDSQLNVESQLLGDGGGEAPPAASPSAPAQSNSDVTSIVVLQRADPSFAVIEVSPSSSKMATLRTTGSAQVTRFDPSQRRATPTVDENAEVSLVYNLSNNSGAWRCVTVNATPLSSSQSDGGSASPPGGRIGW